MQLKLSNTSRPFVMEYIVHHRLLNRLKGNFSQLATINDDGLQWTELASERLLLGPEKTSIFLEPSQKIKCLLPFYIRYRNMAYRFI